MLSDRQSPSRTSGVRSLSDLSVNAVRNLSEISTQTPLWDPVPATERGTGPVLSENCPILSTDKPPLIEILSETERKRQYNRAHYRRNRDKRLADANAHYAANRQAIRTQRAERFAADPEAVRAVDRARYQRDPEKRLAASKTPSYRMRARLREYGLSASEYQILWNFQDGRCAICRAEMVRPQIDHDHRTGEVRGLLCFKCNVGIGHLNDDPDLLRAAIAHLEVRPILRLFRKGAA